jgi:hypothetical protein
VRGRLRAAAGRLLMAVALAAAGLVSVGTTTASAQPVLPPSGYSLGDWNMRGGMGNGDSKWFQKIRPLLKETRAGGAYKFDGLALQEVGTLPSAQIYAPVTTLVPSRTAAGGVGPNYTVNEYAWNIGTDAAPNLVYITVLDVGAAPTTHLNLAFVTRTGIAAANMFVIVPQPLDNGAANPGGRPIFGYRPDTANNTVIWTGHAQNDPVDAAGNATNQNDAVRMIQAVNAVTPLVTAPGAQWLMSADFNLPPGAIQNPPAGHQTLPAGVRVLATVQWTQAAGRVLDYVLTNEPAGGAPAGYTVGLRDMGMVSDHRLLTIGVNLQAAATDGQIGADGSADSCLDAVAPAGKFANDTQLTENTCNTVSQTQTFEINTNETITDNGWCLDNYNSGTADGNLVELWTCKGSPNQTFVVQANGTIFNPISGKCLDSTPPSSQPYPPPGGGDGMSLRTCNGTPSQQWNADPPYLLEPPGQKGMYSVYSQTAVYIVNSAYPDKVLCASPTDGYIYLQPVSGADPYCQWQQIGTSDKVALYNTQMHQNMACLSNGSCVVEGQQRTTDQDFFSWSGQQQWGGFALRPYQNSNQNVNADDPANPGFARTDPVTTHAWNGSMVAMTWNVIPAPTLTGLSRAAVSLIGNAAASATSIAKYNNLYYFNNGQWPDYDLCANKMDSSVYLVYTGSTNPANPYCLWQMIGDNSKFALYNPLKGQVLAYQGGNAGPLVMQDPVYPTPSSQYFSFGGQESWGFSALQSSLDPGQNVDAKDLNSDNGNPGPLHTRGWRTGHQRELTWNANLVTDPLSRGSDCTPTSITAASDQQYVTAQIDFSGNDYGMLRAQAYTVSLMEQFDLCTTTTADYYAIRALINNEFVTTNTINHGTLYAQASSISSSGSEQFSLVPQINGTYGISAILADQFVTAHIDEPLGDYGVLQADSTTVGNPQQFQ